MSIYIRKYLQSNSTQKNQKSSIRYSVKDIFFVKDSPCSFGIKPEYIACAKSSSILIGTLNKHFTLIGSVNLSPLCLDSTAKNPFFGDGHVAEVVDEGKVLYGSSFGSALSVATKNLEDKVDFSIGSDSGGSIRAPAAGLGLYAIRLKSNVVSKENSLLLKTNLDSVGVISDKKSTLREVVRILTPQIPYTRSRSIYIPHNDELTQLSNEHYDYFFKLIEFISKTYEIKVCSQEFFKNFFNERKKILQNELRNLLFQDELQEAIEAIPQAKALQVSLAQTQSLEYVQQDFIFDQNAMLLHPTISSKDPINFYLPAANVLDLFSASFFLEKDTLFSLCISGHNDTELLDFIDEIQKSQ
jgi:Asp-tRNA(Asn)/Glu-tRNA(Gln) amidotransferase A subunit family amidase